VAKAKGKLETKVSSPFMTGLRELPGSKVFKHSDGSMIGMVDASLTWREKTLWMEFKAYLLDDVIESLLDSEDLLAMHLIGLARKDAETQAQLALDLDSTSVCFYVIWVKQTCVVVLRPSTMECVKVRATTDAVALVKRWMMNWVVQLHPPSL